MPLTLESVGWQRMDTSRNAAVGMSRRVRTIRAEVITALRKSSAPLTSEEIAVLINRPYRSVQPRLTELRNALVVVDSGRRKLGYFNKAITAWQIA